MVGHVRLVGFKVADNVENGMVVTEAHGDWGGPLIKVRGLLEVMCVCVCTHCLDSLFILNHPGPLS